MPAGVHDVRFGLVPWPCPSSRPSRYLTRWAVVTGGTGVNPAAVMTPTSIRMTITIVVTLPVLFVYPFFQKYFIKGIMIGAIKG
jgi:ABC-type glycerol-3-phosphate transport system permease component